MICCSMCIIHMIIKLQSDIQLADTNHWSLSRLTPLTSTGCLCGCAPPSLPVSVTDLTPHPGN